MEYSSVSMECTAASVGRLNMGWSNRQGWEIRACAHADGACARHGRQSARPWREKSMHRCRSKQMQTAHLPVSGLNRNAWAFPPVLAGIRAGKRHRLTFPCARHSGLKRRICRQRRRLFTVAGAAHVGWRGQLHVSRLTARLERRAGTKTGRLYLKSGVRSPIYSSARLFNRADE